MDIPLTLFLNTKSFIGEVFLSAFGLKTVESILLLADTKLSHKWIAFIAVLLISHDWLVIVFLLDLILESKYMILQFEYARNLIHHFMETVEENHLTAIFIAVEVIV